MPTGRSAQQSIPMTAQLRARISKTSPGCAIGRHDTPSHHHLSSGEIRGGRVAWAMALQATAGHQPSAGKVRSQNAFGRMVFDVQRDLNPRHLQESFDRAAKLQGELRKKESRIRRQAQQLAWGLAALMDPGDHHHRVHVGIHAFDIDGHTCLASAYLEEIGDQYRYRYAV